MYRNDPKWIEAKYPGRCGKCGGTICAGQRAFYHPRGKYILCPKCGEGAANDFGACLFDEAQLNGGW